MSLQHALSSQRLRFGFNNLLFLQLWHSFLCVSVKYCMTVEKRKPASYTLSFAGLSKPFYFEVKLQGINLVSVN